MGHQVTTVCQICQEDFTCNQIPKHTRMKHNVHILEYKEQFGSPYNHIRKKVYHRCAVCSDLVLLESHKLRNHVSRHQMNWGEYNKQFNMILSHKIQPNRIVPFKPRGKQALLNSATKRIAVLLIHGNKLMVKKTKLNWKMMVQRNKI